MPSLQTRSGAHVLPPVSTYAAGVRPAHPPEPVARRPVAPKRVARAERRAQMAWIGLILIAALVCVSLGLAYLSACASVTREGYRKARLKAMLLQEQVKAQNWRELHSQVMAPTAIETRARALGMIRADDGQAVILK
ncbi:MAG: hypothetical protein RMJ43_11400 [Chloroherpetonaceae bacterium]|nr:hypothetical protein [Chthonomonadaceae bacterium]MDW8208435.1 hypothetical protein [Chloroherpetonaceae bacterium]